MRLSEDDTVTCDSSKPSLIEVDVAVKCLQMISIQLKSQK